MRKRYVVASMGYDTPCWLWQLKLDSQGYGRTGKNQAAHRAYWEMLHGRLPATIQLHHECGVRCCVNPDHLEPLTTSEHGLRARKVSEYRRSLIRFLAEFSPWSKRQLAYAFDISPAQVTRITQEASALTDDELRTLVHKLEAR